MMLDAANIPVMTISEAAARLGVDVDVMLAWKMVVVHDICGRDMVPCWSVDPVIARYMPTLSQVFQGEAMSLCLTTMRPLGDNRNGLQALHDGHWREVLAALKALRAKLDAALQKPDYGLAGLAQGAAGKDMIRLH